MRTNNGAKNKTIIICMIILILIILLSISIPALSPYKYYTSDFNNINQDPSFKHIFGTDILGRDLFVRVFYGTRISLLIGFTAALINVTIGFFYGCLSGFCGGIVDQILMRITDVLLSIPSLLYIILFMMFWGASIKTIIIALCVCSWASVARMVRSKVLYIKSQNYILSADISGLTTFRIVIKHILPNVMDIIIVSLIFLIPEAIFYEAFLSFLGIGIQKPIPSWGSLINEAIPFLYSATYQIVFPIAITLITVLSLNIIGNRVRNIFDFRSEI